MSEVDDVVSREILIADASTAARALYRLMRDISEQCWAAGWQCGLEYALFNFAFGRPRILKYGQSELTAQDRDDLYELAQAAGGWVMLNDSSEPVFLTMPKWLAHLCELEEGDGEL